MKYVKKTSRRIDQLKKKMEKVLPNLEALNNTIAQQAIGNLGIIERYSDVLGKIDQKAGAGIGAGDDHDMRTP